MQKCPIPPFHQGRWITWPTYLGKSFSADCLKLQVKLNWAKAQAAPRMLSCQTDGWTDRRTERATVEKTNKMANAGRKMSKGKTALIT